jgi:hypothetical protein
VGVRMGRSATRGPGGPARNCSRRDGIRAGAVTGPWRSGQTPPSVPVANATLVGAEAGAGPWQPAVARTGPPARTRASTVRPVILAGAALLAVGSVAVAWMAPWPIWARAPGVAAGEMPGRVVLRVPGAADPGSLVARLERAGVADVALSPLAFAITETRVGFYHDADRAAAETLAALLRGADGATPPLRDYGGLVPAPPQGTIDLWIAG